MSEAETVSIDAVVVNTNESTNIEPTNVAPTATNQTISVLTTNLYNEPLKENNFIVNVSFQGTVHEVHIYANDYISDAKLKIHHKLQQHYTTIPEFQDVKILKFGIKKFCLKWECIEDGTTKKMNTIEFLDDVDTIAKTKIQNNQTIELLVLNDDELAKLRDGADQTDREILLLEILCCPCITAGVAAACVVNVAAQAVCCYYRKEMRHGTSINNYNNYKPKSLLEYCLCGR